MKRLTVAAAAFAAATLTIVAQSRAEADHDYLRSVSAATAKGGKAEQAGKEASTAVAKDVQGAKDKGRAAKLGKSLKANKPIKDVAEAKGTRRAKDKNVAAAQQKRSKKGRVRIDLGKPDIDLRTTASLTRVRPELKAVARKAVRGLDKVESTGKVASAASYTTIVAHYASSYGVPASLAHAVIGVESNYRPNARGSAGEIGLMQIKPATARMMGYSGSSSGLFDPETNIRYGIKYLALAHQLSGGSTCGTILRYNAGHGAKRMNPVSAAYCTKVKARLAN